MPARVAVDWKIVDGAFNKPRRLRLQKDEDGLDHCPLPNCDHTGFASRRGCRKHVKTKHPWYAYFDEKPKIVADKVDYAATQTVKSNRGKFPLPCCSLENEFARSFCCWLESTTGGGKALKQAEVLATRALKFLNFCCQQSGEDESTMLSSVEIVDFFLGSSKLLTDFLDNLESACRMGQSGRLGYVASISDLLDFRKFNAPPGSVLQNFSVTEVYIRRAKKCLNKQMRAHWTTDLDIETLESRRSWASLGELQMVVPFHIQRYKEILEECRKKSNDVTPTDLTFATRFLAVLLFVKIKGCRPMTYQYLTLSMFENAKSNGGMVDQSKFKTAKKYGFDSLYFDELSLNIVDDYVRFVRPSLKPQCDYLLVNRNGAQFQKLTDLLSVLVFQAIGKYIHPTRYRQIIETESVRMLNIEEQQVVTEDQKHSSNVARVHYQKRRSREVAMQGRRCMVKLRGREGEAMDSCVKQLKEEHSEKEYGCERNLERESIEDCHPASCVELHTRSCARRKTPAKFTEKEDDYIRTGFEKFGPSWTSILRNPAFHFQEGREARTLRVRAVMLKLL